MTLPRFWRVTSLLTLLQFFLPLIVSGQAKIKTETAEARPNDAEADHVRERAKWFLRGRMLPGKSAAELRRRAYQNKMRARVARASENRAVNADHQIPSSAGGWMPLGPVPLASDASGTGFQDYHQVSGRATAVAIDLADPSGNTLYIGGAQGGVWKSINAATGTANNVMWTPIIDDQATLSIGSIAIQAGNLNPANSVILAGTGEANNSIDSYFGLGILRSADAGNTWTLVPTANGGTLSFSGLGAARIAFSTASGQTNTVVAAMAATPVGIADGEVTSNSEPGLYTSTDAGQTWTYDALAAGASEATSATSVVYNAIAGLFFAAVRYRGFYSSPDGLTWTRLTNQPGSAGLLSTIACPQNYVASCPIFRGEITVVPGRNEMYVWFVSSDLNNNPVDQGIWESTTGGASWTPVSDSGIINCGDFNGCGVEQGFYNLELLAVANGSSVTDLYAGSINLYKCSISSINPSCSSPPFINLTHVYGCNPLGAPAHVHPDEHAMTYTIPASGPNSGAALMYFANDGGIYRALNGFTGLNTGSCAGTNLFDDLNQNLGSMTQFVSFSEHSTDSNTLLGGTQDNGSPATATATTSLSWGNVLSGDGGYNAIDSAAGNWFASNPDTGFGALDVQECSFGVNCNDTLFNEVVNSGSLAGDDGAFYFPYILDPQSATTLLIGTCRVWSGPRSGGTFTLLSLNFDTLGLGICAGTEVNTVRSLAAGGPSDANGSQVVYATTDGPGPNNLTSPIGGNVWVTTNATAVSGTTSTFANVTLNGPGGGSINSNQFPISSVAIDASDATGNTAYVTVMGFTGGPGHIWQTTNAGSSWTDFTGTGSNALPDSPVNAVVVDATGRMVYVGTDVGVFQSATAAAAWTEVGPIPGPTQVGFLPNVAVTALGIFNSGGQKLLRASTYGRGLWQFNLLAAPDFQVAVSNTPLTVFLGSTATFNGTITALNGYNNSVALNCTAGATSPPSPCLPSPVSLTPTSVGSAFLINAGTSGIGDYSFNVQGAGSDPHNTTHTAAVTLHVVDVVVGTPSPASVNAPRGSTSPTVSFQVSAQGSFNQNVTISCFTPVIPGATCSFTPGATVNPTPSSPVPMTAGVTVPVGTPLGDYTVSLQATTPEGPAPLPATFILIVVPNPDFALALGNSGNFPNVKAGSTGTTAQITVTALDGFTGNVTLSCVTAFGPNSCSISPTSVSVFPAATTLTINGNSFAPGSYVVAVQGISGAITHTLSVPFNVGDYSISGETTLSSAAGEQVMANLSFTSTFGYSGQVNITCDATALVGAQCTLTPPSPLAITSGASVPVTMIVNIPSSAIPGNYNININTQDTTGNPVHSLTTTLTVHPDFTLSAATSTSQTISPGQSATYDLKLLAVGASFNSAVSFSCSGGPPGSSCIFTPNPATPGGSSVSVAMTIATGIGANSGTYSLAVTGVSGSLSHSVGLTLIVNNNFQLSVTQPFSTAADAGSQQSAKVSLTPNYSGSATALCVSDIPAQQCSVTPNPVTLKSGTPTLLTLTLNVSDSAAPNSSNAYKVALTVADSSSAISEVLSLPITVIQDFDLGALTPSTQTITVGQSATYNFSVLPVGETFTAAVNLSCFSGTLSLCTFTPNPVTPANGAVAVVMTIGTKSSSAKFFPPKFDTVLVLACFALSGLMLLASKASQPRHANRRAIVSLLGASLLAMLLISCGGGGSNGGGSGSSGQVQTAQPGTYSITVTGTSGSLSHQAPPVTLIVN